MTSLLSNWVIFLIHSCFSFHFPNTQFHAIVSSLSISKLFCVCKQEHATKLTLLRMNVFCGREDVFQFCVCADAGGRWHFENHLYFRYGSPCSTHHAVAHFYTSEKPTPITQTNITAKLYLGFHSCNVPFIWASMQDGKFRRWLLCTDTKAWGGRLLESTSCKAGNDDSYFSR